MSRLVRPSFGGIDERALEMDAQRSGSIEYFSDQPSDTLNRQGQNFCGGGNRGRQK